MPFKDPDVRRAYRERYMIENHERIKEVRKEYYQQNKEKRNAQSRANYKSMKETVGDIKITVELPEHKD